MEEIIKSYAPGIILKYIRTLDFQYNVNSDSSSVNTNTNERTPLTTSNNNIYLNDVLYSLEEVEPATEEYDGITYQVINKGTQQIPNYSITKNLNFNKETSRTTSITGIFTTQEASIYNEIFDRNIAIGTTEAKTYRLSVYEIFRVEGDSYFLFKDGSFRTEVTDKNNFKTKVFPDTEYEIITNMITNNIENYGPTSTNKNRYKIDFMPSTVKKIYIEENYTDIESFANFSNSVPSDIITVTGNFSTMELNIIEKLIKETSFSDFGYVASGKDIFGRTVTNTLKTNNIPGDVNSIKIYAVSGDEGSLVGQAQKESLTYSATNAIASFVSQTLGNNTSTETSSPPDCPINFYKNYFSINKEDALDAGALIWEKQKIKDSNFIDAEIQLNFNIQDIQGIYSENDFLDMLEEINPETGKAATSILSTKPIFTKMESFISKIKTTGKKMTFNKMTALWQYDNRLNIGSNIYIAYIPASWGDKNNVDISTKEITLGIPFAGGIKTKKPSQLQINQDTPIALKNTTVSGTSVANTTTEFNLTPKKQVGKTETYTLDFSALEANSAGIAIQLLTFKDVARKNIQHTRGVEDTANDDMLDSFYVNTWGKAPGKLVLQGVIDKNMVHKEGQKVQEFQKVAYKDGLKEEGKMEWTIEDTFKIFLKWNSSPNRSRFLDELRIIDQNTVKEYIVSMNDFSMKLNSQQQNLYVFSAEFDILEEVGLDQAAKKITPYSAPVPLFTPISKTTTVLPTFEDIKKEVEDTIAKGITTTQDKINNLMHPEENKLYLKGAYTIIKGGTNTFSPSGILNIIRQETCNVFLDFCSHQIQTAGQYSLDFSRSVLPAIANISNTFGATYIQVYISPAVKLKELQVTSILYNQPWTAEEIKYTILYEEGISGDYIEYNKQKYDIHKVKFMKNNASGFSAVPLDVTKVGWLFEILMYSSKFAYHYMGNNFVIQFKGVTSSGKSFIYGLPLTFREYNATGTFTPINIRKPYL